MKTHWNYRLCKEKIEGYDVYSIREVYYEDENICSYSLIDHNHLNFTADKDDSETYVVENYNFVLKKILESINKPIVDLDDLE